MTKPIPFTETTSHIVPARKAAVQSIALCASGATSTLEAFDGAIGIIATTSIADGGTGYEVGDTITLIQNSGSVQATFIVSSVATGVVDGLTLVSAGNGYKAGNTYPSTTNSVAGTGLTVTVDTITDTGTSIGKISVVANESKDLSINGIVDNGVSVRITGTSAVGYLYLS